MLRSELPRNSLYWLQLGTEKNLIVVSGDYGAFGQESFCTDEINNIIFIAEGLDNTKKDRILEIYDNQNGFWLKSVLLDNDKLD